MPQSGGGTADSIPDNGKVLTSTNAKAKSGL